MKGLNLAWAVWHHAAKVIEVEGDDGCTLRYRLIAIVEDNIPEKQKVTKLWKTLVHRTVRVNQEGEVIELLGESNDEREAKKIAIEAESIDGLTIEIQSEATNDKSGKATPLDRILIIAPESSNPTPFLDNEELSWYPILNSNQ